MQFSDHDHDLGYPEWVKNIRQRRREATQSAWKNMAGANYELLVSSVDNALAMMKHAEPAVRIAAISICRVIWRCEHNSEYVNNCLHLIQNDPVDDCRVSAIGALGFSYSGTRDRSIGRFLARLVCDSTIPIQIRNASYISIEQVDNGSSLELANLNLEKCNATFNDALLDINWRAYTNLRPIKFKSGKGEILHLQQNQKLPSLFRRM